MKVGETVIYPDGERYTVWGAVETIRYDPDTGEMVYRVSERGRPDVIKRAIVDPWTGVFEVLEEFVKLEEAVRDA